MPTTTLTMSELIDQALGRAHAVTQWPRRVVLADGLADESDTSLTLVADDDLVWPTTVLEVGNELLLVTAKSADVSPVFTVSRGYLGTPKAAHAAGTVATVNPQFARHQVQHLIERAFSGPLTVWLPNVTSEIVTREPGLQYVELPADTLEVLSVRHEIVQTGRIVDIGTWEHQRHLPVTAYPTGQALRLPAHVADGDELVVVRRVAYSWSTDPVTEESTIEVPLGAEELPVLFALARMVSGREISRIELDRIDEWNQEEAFRQGANVRLIREAWTDFYRVLDEARRVNHVPRHRPYVKMQRF